MAPRSKSLKSLSETSTATPEEAEVPRFPDHFRDQASHNSQIFISEEQSSNHILGPVFPLVVPDGFSTIYPVMECDPLLLQGSSLEWSGWDRGSFLRSWPSTVEPNWVLWVKRMTKFVYEDWKKMGIRETIELSQYPLEFNPRLLAAAACFWSKSSNTLILSSGLVSPTILDIVHLTGLPSVGLDVNALLTPDAYDPPFVLTTNKGLSFSTWLDTYFMPRASATPSLNEKIAFYLFWICRFLLAVPGFRVTKEYLNLAICLAQGKKLALAPFVLGTLYKGMFTFVDKKIADSCGGPFWIFQAWLYAYFPQIKPKSENALRAGDDRKTCRSYAEYLLGFETYGEDSSFQRYFAFFYEDKKENWPVFTPFSQFEYASKDVKQYFEDKTPPSVSSSTNCAEDKRLFWASILIPRLIPVGFALNSTPFRNCSFESYSPCQFARQVGLIQGIPLPFIHPEIIEIAPNRPSLKLKDTKIITSMVNNFHQRVHEFQLQDFKAVTGTTSSFDNWWSIMRAIYFTFPLQDCLYRFDPEFKALQDKAVAQTSEDGSKAIIPHAEDVIPISSVPNEKNYKRKGKITSKKSITANEHTKSPQKAASAGRIQTRPKRSTISDKPKKGPAQTSPSGPLAKSKLDRLTDSLVAKKCLSKKTKRTQIVNAFEEEEEDTSRSSKIQKTSSFKKETDVTEKEIDSFVYQDTTSFDPLTQDTEKLMHATNTPDPVSIDQISKNEQFDNPLLGKDISNTVEHIQNDLAFPKDELVLPDPGKQVILSPTPNRPTGDPPNPLGARTKAEPISEGMEECQDALTVNIPSQPIIMDTKDVASSPGNPNDKMLSPQPILKTITVGTHLMASPQSVNRVDKSFAKENSSFQTKSSSEDLDRLLDEVKSASQAFLSLTQIPESRTPLMFAQFSNETQEEINKFFDHLKAPFDQMVMGGPATFVDCVNKLVQRHVFPLKEQIVLENFSSSLDDTISLFRYHEEEINQKQKLIDQLSGISIKLTTVHDDLLTLKSELLAIDQEEEKLLLRLDQLRSKRNILLTEKDRYTQDFKHLSDEGRGVYAQASVARADLQRNSLKRDEILAKWATFKSFFTHAQP
ncbi:uncharacterized protein LOC131329670 isoform X2 [Rhododendron vialii]|uniref:uncharacterized protein LOC131329670 isoform X2 n=1 Tax=Rhododendron vialii TaxID=182163 RepID=UPI00265FEDD2|nr:uncharacterized protein LOC131329670 isoform X2 [Rhododendron vialii]